METAMLAFKLSIDKSNEALEKELLNHIQKHKMASYYREVCTYFGKIVDEDFYLELKSENDKVIEKKKEEIAEKTKNGSDDDVLDLLLNLVRTFFHFWL